MSARGGPRAKGSDGTDFGHRETVASHYQISSTNKRRLKVFIFIHFLLFIFILLKVSTDILKIFDINTKSVGYEIALPTAVLWEFVWLTSIIFIFAALIALRKNYILPMKVYVGGILATGIFPLVAAIIYHSSEFRLFLQSKETDEGLEKFYGIPVVLILSVFVCIAFLTHSLSIMSANNLIQAWTPKKGKKKT